MSDNKTFPNFFFDECFWCTNADLKSWASLVDGENTDFKIVFAPEGRDDESLKNEEKESIQWFIENEKEVFNSIIDRLFLEYPKIREIQKDIIDPESFDKDLPIINSKSELTELLVLSDINIHQISKDSKPFIGIILECPWDEEHGIGLLMHGNNILEIGGADTAILLWKAKKYL